MSLAFLPAPRPAGVVHDFQSKPNTITIVRTSDFNQYIRPPTNDTEVREDFVLTGFVIVHLREARKAKELKIRFVAEARLAYPDRPWEDEVIFENNMSIDSPDDDGIPIDAGPQFFEYSFVIPSTLAGFDRTPYGRVSHRVEATLVEAEIEFPGRGGGELVMGNRKMSSGGGAGGRAGSNGGRSRSGMSGAAQGSGLSTPSSPILVGNQALTASPVLSPMASPLSDIPSYQPYSNAISSSASSSSSNLAPPPPINPDLGVMRRQSSGTHLPGCFTDRLPCGSLLSNGAEWKDLQWLSGNMVAQKEMWIIPLPTEDREPLSLNIGTRSLVEGLGILPWSLQTEAITVGGWVFFQLALQEFNPSASIWCIRLYINQKYSLLSPRRPEEGERHFPPVDLKIYEKGVLPRSTDEWYSSKGKNGAGPIWEGDMVPGPAGKKDLDLVTLTEILRMPDENRLRPSTCPGTVTPIRVRHEFSIQIFFSVWGEDGSGKPLPTPGPGKLRKAVLKQGALICSCCCTKKNLALPTYEQSTLHANPINELDCDVCACGEILGELSEREIARDLINERGIPFGAAGQAAANAEEAERGRSAKAVYDRRTE